MQGVHDIKRACTTASFVAFPSNDFAKALLPRLREMASWKAYQ